MTTDTTNTSPRPQRAGTPLNSLPHVGRGRWSDIAPFVGICREKWRQLVMVGRAPQPIRLTERCTLYDFSQVHAWIADPLNYQATVAAQARTAKRRSSA